MPEGPEVALMAKRLHDHISTAIVEEFEDVKQLSHQTKDSRDVLRGLRIDRVWSTGKWLIFDLSSNKRIWAHNGLSGGWWVPQTPTHRHTRFVLHTSKGHLAYRDSRGFGRFWIVDRGSADDDEIAAKLGPDVLHHEYMPAEMLDAWMKKKWTARSNIATVLKDQTRFAGVGNYLRSEILYALKWSPKKSTRSLTKDDVRQLWHTAHQLASKAFDSGFRFGRYSDLAPQDPNKECQEMTLQVYDRKKDQKGNAIIKEKIGGQAVFWVPAVQTM